MTTQLALDIAQEMVPKEAITRFLTEELLPVSGVRDIPSADENLLDSGILDSLGIMKLLGYLEATFSIRIREEDLLPENFESINAITLLLQGYEGHRRDTHG